MKIAVEIMDFLNPPPRNIDNSSGPAQRKRVGRNTARARPALTTETAAGRVSRSREERITDPALLTAVTPAGPAPVAEGEVVAAAAASILSGFPAGTLQPIESTQMIS
jgi:hypothetical protein